MEFEITAGDRVQARKSAGDDVATVEFTVVTAEGGVFTGSPLGPISDADGWDVELVRRGDPSMPGALADIAVWLVENRTEPCRVFGGPGFGWQTPQGRRIDPTDVLHWEPWGDEHDQQS